MHAFMKECHDQPQDQLDKKQAMEQLVQLLRNRKKTHVSKIEKACLEDLHLLYTIQSHQTPK